MQYREFKKKSVAFGKKKTLHSSVHFLSNIMDSLKNIFHKINLWKVLWVLILLWSFMVMVLWVLFLRGVPDIESLERGDYFRESTVIYDKDKNPIYTLFNDGKRTYIDYNNISPSIKDAIVSTEDKTFYENPWIDLMGIVRAFWRYALGNTSGIKGTSTISQQLIKNTLLTNERSLKRKFQEAYLSYKLNKTYSKEKILEMYLNTISFWYNANGIEEASKTYFWKSAKDVGPLGASILGSLPKGPTYYSPYSHRDRLMWFIFLYPVSDSLSKISIDTSENRKEYAPLYNEFKNYLSGITIQGDTSWVKICGVKKEYVRDHTFSPESDGCVQTDYDNLLNFFGDILIKKDFTGSGWTDSYAVEYTIGRKDFVAGRMFTEGKIDGPTFKKVVYDGLEFEFNKYTENIKYPYFVMYIKEYLEAKYGKDIDITQGLKVYTTLDPSLQEKGEELVRKQVAINKAQYGATSAALVSMDNKTGKLLVMIGWPDYFDSEHGGNNNMILAKRQPGSSFKPIEYALAISKNPIGPETPIADIKTIFGKWPPNNYDNKFKWIMMVKNALAYSRNIPAVKMFYLAWWEESVVTFANTLGINYKHNVPYSATMSIWTAELKPIELMQAYSVFANLGVKRDVYAIDKIEDSDGNILEEHKETKDNVVFSPAASYILTQILSNPDNRPDGFWRNALTVWGRVIAAKTGTSNKPAKKWTDTILPGDLWTVGYSPQITSLVWAGNVDGSATKWSCDGLNCAAGIWKPFMEFSHKNLPKEDWKKPEGIYTYTISKTSGKLATDSTPDSQKISTIMAVKLTDADWGYKDQEIDTLCNGPVSENTPQDSIGHILIPTTKPIIDGYDPAWTTGFFASIGSSFSWSGDILSSELPCERPGVAWVLDISISLAWVNANTDTSGKKIIVASWKGHRAIAKISIKYDDKVLLENTYGSGGKKEGSERIATNLPQWEDVIHVDVVDIYGFRYTESKSILIGGDSSVSINETASKIPPSITMINPKGNDGQINLYNGDAFNLRFSTVVSTLEREITILIDGNVVQSTKSGDIFVFPINSTGLSVGSHNITIQVTDANIQVTKKNIILNILPR